MANSTPCTEGDNVLAISKYRIFHPPEEHQSNPVHDGKQSLRRFQHRSNQAETPRSDTQKEHTWHAPTRHIEAGAPASERGRPQVTVMASRHPLSSSESRMDNVRFSVLRCTATAAEGERKCRRPHDGSKGVKKRRPNSPELWETEALCPWTTPPTSAHGVETKDLFAMLHAQRVRAPMDYTRPSTPSWDAAEAVVIRAPKHKTGRTAAVQVSSGSTGQCDELVSRPTAKLPQGSAMIEKEERSAQQSARQGIFPLGTPPHDDLQNIPVCRSEPSFVDQLAAGQFRDTSERSIAMLRTRSPFVLRHRSPAIIECGSDLTVAVRREKEEEKRKETETLKQQKRVARYAMRELRRMFPPLLPRGDRRPVMIRGAAPSNHPKMGIKGEPPPLVVAFRNFPQTGAAGQGMVVGPHNADVNTVADSKSKASYDLANLDPSCVKDIAHLNRRASSRLGDELEDTLEINSQGNPNSDNFLRHNHASALISQSNSEDTILSATSSMPDISISRPRNPQIRPSSDPTTKLPRLIVGTGLLHHAAPEPKAPNQLDLTPKPRPVVVTYPHVPTGGMVFGEAAKIAERSTRRTDRPERPDQTGRCCVVRTMNQVPEWMGDLALSLSTSLSLMRG